MSTFRKFTNACAGFAAFYALMECFTQYMMVSPDDLPSLKEKLLLFFSSENPKDYTGHLILILWILLALAVSVLFRKLPCVGFAAVTIPFAWGWILFFDGRLYNRPILIPLLLTLSVAGAAYDCIAADRQRPRGNGFLLGNLASAAPLLFCAWILGRSQPAESVSPEHPGLIQGDILRAIREGESFEIFRTVALLYLVSILISILFYQLYYLDGILSLIPLGYVVFHLYEGSFPLLGAVLTVLALLSTVIRLSVMFCCPPSEFPAELPTEEKPQTE